MASAAASNTPRGDYPQLAAVNGLRGVAIGLVIFYHLLAGAVTPESLNVSLLGVTLSLSPLATNGWTGVNLFFVLSGLVLFLPYAQNRRSMATVRARLSFYWRRAWRLLPLFYVAVLVLWAVVPRPEGRDAGELLSVMSGAYAFDAQRFGPSFLPPLWSIGVEILFSAAFPALVLLHARIGTARLVALAVTAALACRCAGILRMPLLQGPSFNSDMILCRLDEFVLGMAVAQAWASGRLPARTGRWALLGLGLVGAAWVGYDLVLRELWPPLVRAGLNDVLDAGIIALLVAALAPQGRLAAALSRRPLQFVGKMSYSLYLWHVPLLWLLMPHRAALSIPAFIGVTLVYLTVTLAVGALSYRLIEFPPRPDWRRLSRLALPRRVA
jgi:peptidoglycan/LPS O-acetylase OafA/YrhL